MLLNFWFWIQYIQRTQGNTIKQIFNKATVVAAKRISTLTFAWKKIKWREPQKNKTENENLKVKALCVAKRKDVIIDGFENIQSHKIENKFLRNFLFHLFLSPYSSVSLSNSVIVCNKRKNCFFMHKKLKDKKRIIKHMLIQCACHLLKQTASCLLLSIRQHKSNVRVFLLKIVGKLYF